MRHIINLHGTGFSCHTERPFTCALFGQLDASKEKPERYETRNLVRPGDGDYPAICEYARKMTNGWYAMGPLDWFESEAEAEAAKEKWPDRINMQVVKVATTVENG